MKLSNKQVGFTLIEMSIVLVIIGILTASAMYAGRTTIQSTNTIKTISVVTNLQNAIHEFKSIYKEFPGDIRITTGQPEIPGLSNQCNGIGDGDGLIMGELNSTGQASSGEASCVPEHLYLAGLLTTQGKNTNTNLSTIQTPFGEVTVIAKINSHAKAVESFGDRNVVNVIELTNLPCSAAKKLDTNFDNADLSRGRAVGLKEDGTVMAECVQDQVVPFFVLAV